MSSDFLSKDIVYVSSANRVNGNSHDFNINLTNQIRTPNDYDTATLLSFTCPKSYYLFNSSNNTFTVNENGSTHTITIPVGNYDFASLANTLSELFQASLSYTYVIVSSQITGHYEFTVSNNGGVQPIFNFSGDSPYSIMGFEQESYTFSANYLEGPNIVNFQLTNTIELCCDFVDKSVLSIIIPNSTDFSFINYNEFNSHFTSHPTTKNNIGSARFYLIDGNTGKPLDLNGLNFNFTFVIYKKNDYYSHMLEDRKLELKIKELESELKLLEEKRK